MIALGQPLISGSVAGVLLIAAVFFFLLWLVSDSNDKRRPKH